MIRGISLLVVSATTALCDWRFRGFMK